MGKIKIKLTTLPRIFIRAIIWYFIFRTGYLVVFIFVAGDRLRL